MTTVNAMQVTTPVQGVTDGASAAATGATATSLAGIFGQILAAMQSAVADGTGVEVPGQCAEAPDGSTDETAVESADASVALAGVLAAMAAPVPVPTEAVAQDSVPIESIAGAAAQVPTDAATGMTPEEAVEAALMAEQMDGEGVVTETSPETNDAALLAEALRAAAARGEIDPKALVAVRRFGDVAIEVTGDRSQRGGVTDVTQGFDLRDLAHQAANAVREAAGQQAANGDAGESLGEQIASDALSTDEKPGKTIGATFDPKSMLAGTMDAHAAKSRPEGVSSTAQARLPESVSVRDVGDFVVRSVHYLSGRTDDVVTVRLIPQSLGELRVSVRSGSNGLEVTLTAANGAARDALEGNLVGLRQALGGDGTNVDRVHVQVQVFAPFDAGNNAASGQQGQHGASSHPSRQPQTAYREPAGSPPQQQGQQQGRRNQHAGRLNMWV